MYLLVMQLPVFLEQHNTTNTGNIRQLHVCAITQNKYNWIMVSLYWMRILLLIQDRFIERNEFLHGN